MKGHEMGEIILDNVGGPSVITMALTRGSRSQRRKEKM